jgi:pimeloyl-ACP methyl ester carboxylesterase
MKVPSGAATRLTRRVQVSPGLILRVIDYPPQPTEALAVPANGDKPVVVLVHGLSSNANMWNGVGDSLAAHGHRSLAVDQRGHGLSDKPEGPYDMATVVDDLSSLLETEGIEQPILAGQSWGANVVMEFAARFPGRVRGVVPVDGGFIDLAASFPEWEECERVMAPPRLAGTPAVQLRGWMRSSHPDWSDDAIDSMMGFVDVDPATGAAQPWLTFENHIKVLRGLWEHRPLESYRSVTDPVWWIVAEPHADARGWAGRKRPALEAVQALLPRSKATWIIGDHDLHAQYPGRVASVILEAVEEGFF